MRAVRPNRLFAVLAGVTLIAACSGDPAGPAAQGDVSIVAGAVAQGSSGFVPNPLTRTLAEGGRVTWLNQDIVAGAAAGTNHRLISDDGLFDSGDVEPGQAFSFEFAGPGSYGYRCLNHPTMTGTVTITP